MQRSLSSFLGLCFPKIGLKLLPDYFYFRHNGFCLSFCFLSYEIYHIICVFLPLLIAFKNITPFHRLAMCALFRQKTVKVRMVKENRDYVILRVKMQTL